MATEIEQRFDQAMMSIYTRAKEEAGYNGTRYLQMLHEHRGLKTAQILLESDAPSDGYVALWQRNRLDLAVEYLVIQPEWSSLFTDAELARAARRLRDYGMSVPAVGNTPLNYASPQATIRSAKAAEPVGPYPHARRTGNLLFLSGVGPRKRNSKDIPGAVVDDKGNLTGYSIEAEMRSCFENINAILEEAGTHWENIVDVQVFLTDMKRDWQTYNRIYGEFFPAGPNQPTRTTIEIKSLPTGGNTPIHFEIKVIATV